MSRRLFATALGQYWRWGVKYESVCPVTQCFASCRLGSNPPNRQSWTASRSVFSSVSVRSPVVGFPLAQTGEGIAECEVLQWFVEEGQKIDRFEKVCEVQSDKATMEITTPHEGHIRRIHHSVGDVVKVGEFLVDIEVEGSAEEAGQVEESEGRSSTGSEGVQESNTVQPTASADAVLATPAVRNLAKQSGVDLSQVKGTGPKGRILKEDVLHFIENALMDTAKAAGITVSDASAAQGSAVLEAVRKPIKGYRRAMVKSMTEAASIPHFHYCDDVNVTCLVDFRNALAQDPVLNGAKLTFVPILLKALSIALQNFPEVNSSLSEDHTEIIMYPHHNFGIAMATPDGLVVPNIKRVETKSITELAVDLQELQRKAMDKVLTSDEVSGGTLTLSNVGTIGGKYATPLVNPPEVAIVALGKVESVTNVIEENGDIVPYEKSVMPISWGADHRVVDGATLALFSNAWKKFLEEPERLLLHLK